MGCKLLVDLSVALLTMLSLMEHAVKQTPSAATGGTANFGDGVGVLAVLLWIVATIADVVVWIGLVEIKKSSSETV